VAWIESQLKEKDKELYDVRKTLFENNDRLESQLKEEREDYFSIIEFLIEHKQYIPKYHEDTYTKLKLNIK
jgi:hypothetical protein